MMKMGDMGERIKEARRQKGMTLVELAKEMGVWPDYLAKIEMGRGRVPEERVEHTLSVIKDWDSERDRIMGIEAFKKKLESLGFQLEG